MFKNCLIGIALLGSLENVQASMNNDDESLSNDAVIQHLLQVITDPHQRTRIICNAMYMHVEDREKALKELYLFKEMEIWRIFVM